MKEISCCEPADSLECLSKGIFLCAVLFLPLCLSHTHIYIPSITHNHIHGFEMMELYDAGVKSK